MRTHELNKWYMYNGDMSTIPEIKVGDKIEVTLVESTGDTIERFKGVRTLIDGFWNWDYNDYKNIVQYRFTKFGNKVKEVTMAELEEKYGCKVKVVK